MVSRFSNISFTSYRGDVVRILNGFNPTEQLQVRCRKHPSDWILINFSVVSESLSDLIDDAFDRCEGCLNEKKWAESRFPEGAEL